MNQARVTVTCANPDVQIVETFDLPTGARISDLLALAAVLERFPSLVTGLQPVGIFGRLEAPDTILRPGDRIELYRPLKGDPKETRRQRRKRKQEWP